MDILNFFDQLAESLGDGYIYRGNPEHLEILQAAINGRDSSIWNDFVSRQQKGFVANLAGARLRGADLRFVNLSNANLVGADLRQAVLIFSHFDGANLSGVNFLAADLGGSSLVDTDLSGALCDGTTLSMSRLMHANLKGANLIRAHLGQADLSGADLTNASLSQATLLNAKLDGAILTGCNLYETNRDNWSITGVKCDHVFMDISGKERIPERGEFEEGEFERYMLNLSSDQEALSDALRKGREKNHVFISYVREDQEQIARIVRQLEANSITVWTDKHKLQSGVDLELAIENAIENGVYFIACFSTNYWKKGPKNYMNAEIQVALEQLRLMPDDHVWFIPVKLDECEIPSFQIRRGKKLSSKQWVELRLNWEEGVNRIVAIIKQS